MIGESKKIVMDVLERVHPNNYEILKYTEDYPDYISQLLPYKRLNKKNDSFTVLIHYPEITITNSADHKHNIKNLFVILRFYQGKLIRDIYGFRTTLSFKEYLIGYKHSHLSSSTDMQKIKQFCTGEGSFNESLNMVKATSRNGNLNEVLFESFIYNLKQYVSWESVEGVPYKYMLDIEFSRDNENINYETKLNFTPEFKEILQRRITLEDQTRDNYVKVKINSTEELAEALPKEYKQYLFYGKTFTKRFFGEESCDTLEGSLTTRNFDMKLKIVASKPLEGIENFSTTIPDKFITMLENKLTENLNNILLWKN